MVMCLPFASETNTKAPQ